jgi:hypothetical protein
MSTLTPLRVPALMMGMRALGTMDSVRMPSFLSLAGAAKQQGQAAACHLRAIQPHDVPQG